MIRTFYNFKIIIYIIYYFKYSYILPSATPNLLFILEYLILFKSFSSKLTLFTLNFLARLFQIILIMISWNEIKFFIFKL